MAYIEGTDLRTLLQRERRLALDRALRVVGEVAGALDAAHAAGLVHRDVKPGNILLAEGEGERAYICDFGLARHVSSVSSLTGERGFVGTIDYVPPEQIEGGTIDRRADVYSLACVLYECLAGEPPFSGESELSVVFAHLNAPPPLFSDVRPELPRELDAVFATALAKSPDQRYATCGALADAAAAAAQGKTVAPLWRGRRRAVLTGAGVLAAAGAAAGGYLASRPEHSTAGPAITATSIAGAALGRTAHDYERLFGKPWRESRTEVTDHVKLTFPKRDVAVYFKGLTNTAVEITTWNRRYRTAEGLGPCSPISELRRTYGDRLKPAPFNVVQGRVYAYLVGKNLMFAASGRDPVPGPSKYVTAVALYYGNAPAANEAQGASPFAGFIALKETKCAVATPRATR
jgi:Protein kinase domain